MSWSNFHFGLPTIECPFQATNGCLRVGCWGRTEPGARQRWTGHCILEPAVTEGGEKLLGYWVRSPSSCSSDPWVLPIPLWIPLQTGYWPQPAGVPQTPEGHPWKMNNVSPAVWLLRWSIGQAGNIARQIPSPGILIARKALSQPYRMFGPLEIQRKSRKPSLLTRMISITLNAVNTIHPIAPVWGRRIPISLWDFIWTF